MKRIRYWLMQVVGISKAETNGLISLIILLIIILIIPGFYKLSNINQYDHLTEDSIILDNLIAQIESRLNTSNKASKVNLTLLKPFNPNKASQDDLISLGIPEFISKRIINYRSKGGQFLSKTDLHKIYGVDDSLYLALAPFIQLPVNKLDYEPPKLYKVKPPSQKVEKFELNSADTSDFQKIYGIGPVLSKRIVNYRDKLGGFVNTNQIYEVYGLKDEVAFKLLVESYLDNPLDISRIKINSVDEFTLKQHPYINGVQAKTIISYRFQHGNFRSYEDLEKIIILDSIFINKMKPYLSFD